MLTSAREVEARIRAATPGRWAVGDGAYLQIAKTKGPPKGSWVFRYWRDGRSVWMGLGPTSLVSLAEARRKARAGRKLRLDDIDPRQHKRDTREAKRAKERAELSLRDAVKDFLAAHEATWRSAKHRKQWRSTVAAILPQLGSRPVAAIDQALINDVTAPLVLRTPVTGARVRQRITKVLDWVKAGKPLPQALVAKPVKHLAAAPWQTLPALMAELRAVDTIPARALELAVLTASRTSTVTGAVWSEFDLANRVWRIPAQRMKAERDHSVPLSDRAMAILAALPREAGNDRLFGGRAKGGALGDRAMARVLRASSRRRRRSCTASARRSAIGRTRRPASEPRHRIVAGAHDRKQGRSRLPARRPLREADQAHARLGPLLRLRARHVSRCRRQHGVSHGDAAHRVAVPQAAQAL